MQRERGVAGPQPMSTAVHRSPNKLCRSNSILTYGYTQKDHIEGWPVLTVESEVNGDSRSTNESNCWFDGVCSLSSIILSIFLHCTLFYTMQHSGGHKEMSSILADHDQ